MCANSLSSPPIIVRNMQPSLHLKSSFWFGQTAYIQFGSLLAYWVRLQSCTGDTWMALHICDSYFSRGTNCELACTWYLSIPVTSLGMERSSGFCENTASDNRCMLGSFATFIGSTNIDCCYQFGRWPTVSRLFCKQGCYCYFKLQGSLSARELAGAHYANN